MTKRDAEAFAATVEVSKLRGEFIDATASRATVGELGPEYIFPDRDGYVATARETAKMMAAGKDLSPELSRKAAGRNPSEALAPMGDFKKDQ